MKLNKRVLGGFAGLLLVAGSVYWVQQIPLAGKEAGAAAPAEPASEQKDLGPFMSHAELEARFGIKVTLIAVSANGGLVDLRYKIVDAEKANPLLHDPSRELTLIALPEGTVLHAAKMGMKHHSDVKQNYVPYTYFPNVNTSVKKGTLVSVAFGDIKLEPLAALE